MTVPPPDAPRTSELSEADDRYLSFALELARSCLLAGNIPIASVIADGESLISVGVNQRVQEGSMIRHAEMEAIENAGRSSVPRLRGATLYSTLAPCTMCTGAILLYGIPRVVIADRRTYGGYPDLLTANEVDILYTDSPMAQGLMAEFIRKNPELWHEDNGGR